MVKLPEKIIDEADVAMISDYIVEQRDCGFFLPPIEEEIIRKWLRASPSVDHLILVLSDVLPLHFKDAAEKRIPKSLRGIDKRIKQRIREVRLV